MRHTQIMSPVLRNFSISIFTYHFFLNSHPQRFSFLIKFVSAVDCKIRIHFCKKPNLLIISKLNYYYYFITFKGG